MLLINPNCKIIQDITKSMYNMIILKNITKFTHSENTPRKNSQKTAETEIENSHPYRAELVQNIPKNQIPDKSYRPKVVGGLDCF